eukprot:244886_1
MSTLLFCTMTVITAMMFQLSLVFSQTNNICENMEPICTDEGLQFTALNTNLEAPESNEYGCLESQPDPTWYYLKISHNSQDSGTLSMILSAPSDIDFIIWGPYYDLTQAQSLCGSLGTGSTSLNGVQSCSYDGASVEYPDLSGVSPGQIYVMLITNYAEIVQQVSLTLSSDGSTAFTDCSIVTANATCTKDENYVIDGSVCQVRGDPHFNPWSGTRAHHDFMGQPATGQSQYYYVARCNGATVDDMPFTIIGKHKQWSGSGVTGLQYVTMELYDDDGSEYIVFLSSSIARYGSRGASTLYDEQGQLAYLTSGVDTTIGNRFSIQITRSSSRMNAVLTIDGTCTVQFWMDGSMTGMHTLYITPPDCYRCFICGLCGDFRRAAAATSRQKLETCGGGFVEYTKGWGSDNAFAYDTNGNTWEVNYCSQTRRRLSGTSGEYTPDIGDFTYVEPCDSSIEQQVAESCQTARDNAVTCCDLIGGTLCDELQESCEFDVCVVAGTDTSVIDETVAMLFTAAVDLACEIPNIAYLFDEDRVIADTVIAEFEFPTATSTSEADLNIGIYIGAAVAVVLVIACAVYMCRKIQDNSSDNSTKNGYVSARTVVPSSTQIIQMTSPSVDALPTDWVELHTSDGRIYYQNNITKETRWDKPIAAPPTSVELPPGTAIASDIVPHKSIYPVLPNRASNPQSNESSAQLNEEDPLPSGWVKLHTSDNRIYYQNNATKQTQWTMPSHSEGVVASTVATNDTSKADRTTTEQSDEDLDNDIVELQIAPSTMQATSSTTVAMNDLNDTAPDVLPTDWIEMHTPDGRPYYQNNITKQTQWDKPTAPQSANKLNEKAADAMPLQSTVQSTQEVNTSTMATHVESKEDAISSSAPIVLPPDWIEMHTSDGRVYYQNNITKQTQWDKPTAPQSANKLNEKAADAMPLQSTVQSTQEVNTSTMATHVESKEDAISSSAPIVLPPDWIEMHTSDGRVYYQNNITKQTQWDKPKAAPPPDSIAIVISPMDSVAYTPGYINNEKDDDRVLHDMRYSGLKQFFEDMTALTEEIKVEYFKLFVLNGFDTLEIVQTVSHQDLLDIGVTKLGHRKIILLKAQSVDNKDTPPQYDARHDNLHPQDVEVVSVLQPEPEPVPIEHEFETEIMKMDDELPGAQSVDNGKDTSLQYDALHDNLHPQETQMNSYNESNDDNISASQPEPEPEPEPVPIESEFEKELMKMDDELLEVSLTMDSDDNENDAYEE